MSSVRRHSLKIQHNKRTTTSVLQQSTRELLVQLRFFEIAGWSRPILCKGFRSKKHQCLLTQTLTGSQVHTHQGSMPLWGSRRQQDLQPILRLRGHHN